MTNPKPQLPTPDRKAIEKPYDVRERTFAFAVRMLQVAAALPRTSEAAVVRRQIARAGASVGANVEEADGASTKPDKRRSLGVARKEAREVRYWLRIVGHLWGSSVPVENDVIEASELVKILSAIIMRLE